MFGYGRNRPIFRLGYSEMELKPFWYASQKNYEYK